MEAELPILRDPESNPPARSGSGVAGHFLPGRQRSSSGLHCRQRSGGRRDDHPKLEKLLAGEDLATEAMESFRNGSKQDEKEVDLQFSGEVQTATFEQAKATPPAAKSQPDKFPSDFALEMHRGQRAGKYPRHRAKAAQPRIYVIDGYKSIAEIGLGRQTPATYRAKLANDEIFTLLRTAEGSDGKRYFAAFAPGNNDAISSTRTSSTC